MADNKDIDKKIKDSFESRNDPAPDNLWENLSKELDTSGADRNIDSRIRESFQSLDETAPQHIWEGVNKQLNINRVWRKIRLMLDRRTALRRWGRRAAAALLLLLLGWEGYRYFSGQDKPVIAERQDNQIANTEHQPDAKQENEQSVNIKQAASAQGEKNNLKQGNEKTHAVQPEDTYQQPASWTYKASYSGYKQPENPGHDEDVIAERLTPHHELFYTAAMNEISIERVPRIPVEHESETEKTLVLPSFDEPWDSLPGRRKQFGIGVTYSYNNTWFLNSETRKGFSETSSINTNATYAASYGLVAYYQIGNKSALTTELYINSKARQDYGVYIEGSYIDKSVELNYSKITLLYQRNIIQYSSNRPSRYTLKAGIYTGVMKSSHWYYNGEIVSNSDNYSNIDYGIKLAIGQEKEWNRLVVGYGLNLEYGLKNIYSGNERIPADFNETHTFHAGGYLGVRYTF